VISMKNSHTFDRWWTVPEWGLSICTPPRCGSSTILHYFAEEGIFVYQPNEIKGRAIMIYRDPVSRFTSLYKHKCRDGMELTVGDGGHNPIEGMNPRELIEFIETTNLYDPHWATLTELDGGHSTETLHYLKINDFLGCSPQVYNQTTGFEIIGPKVTERVKEWYRDDYRYL